MCKDNLHNVFKTQIVTPWGTVLSAWLTVSGHKVLDIKEKQAKEKCFSSLDC